MRDMRQTIHPGEGLGSRWSAGRRGLAVLGLGLAAILPGWAHAADGLQALQHYLRDVKGGRAAFTQTVTAPDGKKQKVSQGVFVFDRPGRFRFDYLKPYPQTIVGDGSQVWLYDPDLNQVTVRPIADALGATPAALLAGGASMDQDFELSAAGESGGLSWVDAVPRNKEAAFRRLRIGFDRERLAVIEIHDALGQVSMLDFAVSDTIKVDAERFRFTPPTGADVIRQ